MRKFDWSECNDPWRMLPLLRRYANDRKFRLFAIECCRPLKSLLRDDRSFWALEICEQFAEGFATIESLQMAYVEAYTVYEEIQDDSEGAESAALAIASACWVKQDEWEKSLIEVIDNSIGLSRFFIPWKNAKHIQKRRLCRIIRDIFGLPLQSASFEIDLLTWSNGLIAKLARTIYDSRDFGALPILADAIEEAGCFDDYILHHARELKEHFRGCWLIDSILEQEKKEKSAIEKKRGLRQDKLGKGE